MSTIYNSVEDAVKYLKLDRRRKYFEWSGYLTYNVKFTSPCTECSCDCSDGYGCNHGNAGCDECGYTGKRVGNYPNAVVNDDGEPIKIKS